MNANTDPAREAGRLRDRMMPADSPTLCQRPRNRKVFDAVIWRADGTRLHEANIAVAKQICGDCTVRALCFEVHGHDLELGVVAGMTDGERARLLGGVA